MLVTTGATEAIAAALLAFCDPGDEVHRLRPVLRRLSRRRPASGATLVGVPLEAAATASS